MPVPTLISSLSTTPASNSPPGSESPTTADDYLRTYAAFIATLRDGKGFTSAVTLASGATTDIGAQSSLAVDISGTTTITSFGTTYNGPRFIQFTGILTLTHNATSLILPGAANITTAAGDCAIVVPKQALDGWRVVSYLRASAMPATLGANTFTGTQTLSGVALNEAATVIVASATSTAIGAAASNNVDISGTTTITSFDTVAEGINRKGRFTGALTLTHNAMSLILPGGANITTAANDRYEARSLGSGNWLVTKYQKADGTAIVGASPLTVSYSSGNQTITSAGLLTLAHGLGTTPRIVLLWLVCTTADQNYSAGDRTLPVFASDVAQQGAAVDPDATNIEIRMGSDAASFRVVNKSTGNTGNITNSSWRLLVEAFA